SADLAEGAAIAALDHERVDLHVAVELDHEVDLDLAGVVADLPDLGCQIGAPLEANRREQVHAAVDPQAVLVVADRIDRVVARQVEGDAAALLIESAAGDPIPTHHSR